MNLSDVMQFFSENSDLFSSLASIFVAISAVITAILARSGIRSWTRQYIKKSNHELAQQLLVSFGKYRDCVQALRSPMIRFSPAPSKEHPDASNDELRHIGFLQYLETHNIAIANARQEIYSHILEAEVVFGPKIRHESDELMRLEKKLFFLLRMHIESVDPKSDKYTKRENTKYLEEQRYDVFHENDEDAFGLDFQDRYSRIEEILRAQLLSYR